MKLLNFLFMGVIAAILLCTVVFAQDAAKPVTAKEGEPAPDFKIQTIDGRNLALSMYKDQLPVLLDLWATWCPPCRAEMPELQKLYDKYPGEFEILAVSIDKKEDAGKIKEFIEQNKIKFKIAHDVDQIVQKLYPTEGIPFLTVIGKDGKVVKQFTGYSEEVPAQIEKLLGLKAPSTADEFVKRGYAYYDFRNELDKALADFDEALKMDSKNPKATCGKGEIMLDKGDMEGAVKYLDTAIELDPTNVRAFYNRATIEERQAKYKEAQKIYEMGLEKNPGDETLLSYKEGIDNKLKVLGTAAPDFTIKTIKGDEFSLAKQKGKKAVIIDNWATWCGPCRMTMPELQKFYDKYSKEVAVIGISNEKDIEVIKKFIDENKFSFLIAQDPDRKVTNMYPSKYIPFLTVINKDGIIVETFTGYDPMIIEKLEKMLGL